MPKMPRFILLPFVFLVAATPARALEGTPPFDIVPAGGALGELSGEVAISPDLGLGAGFLHGPGSRSMRPESYAVVPLGIRYGVWTSLEMWGVIPMVWGRSPQEYVQNRGLPEAETVRATLSGFDGGDPAVGLRWEFLPPEDEGKLQAVLSAGFVIPLGTNVWQNNQYNFRSARQEDLGFASGDGAWKLLAAVEGIWDTDDARVSFLAGYLRAFSQEATALEPPASTINVTIPSPVLGWIRPAWKATEDTWLTGRIDWFWAYRGSASVGGLLAKEPGSLVNILDSYENLLDGSWGIWAGIGARHSIGENKAISADLCAPVLGRDIYRLWRLTATVTWSWKR